MKPIPLKDAKLMPSTYYEPYWFAMSPSMSSKIGSCGESARLHYVEKIRPVKVNIALLRGSIVHHTVEHFLLWDAVDPSQMVAIYMRNEAKAIHDAPMTDGDVWEMLQQKYIVPLAKETKKDKEAGVRRPAFDQHEFILQCINTINAITNYIVTCHLRACENKDGKRMVEVNKYYKMVDENGELLATKVNGDIVTVRNILDLVCKDSDGKFVVYDWKTGTKRSSVSTGITPAHTGHALLSYAHSIFSEILSYSLPITVVIVRPVVKYNGDLVEVEEWPIEVRREDTWAIVHKYAAQAKMIMNVQLHKDPSFMCTSCDYAPLCFLNEKNGYTYMPDIDEELTKNPEE